MLSSRRKFLGAGMAMAASGLYLPKAHAQNLTLRDTAFLAGGIPNPFTVGLRLWLKADAQLGFANGDPVGTFTDSSGLGRNFTAAGTARPTYNTAQKSGLPGITFNGTTNVMQANLDTGVTAYSMFMVLKEVTLTTTRSPFKHGDDTSSYMFITATANRSLQHRTGATPTTLADGLANITNFELWSAISTAAPSSSFRLNGADQTLTPATGVFSAPPAGAFLGAYNATTFFANMILGEFMLYNVALTNGQRNATEAYLMAKWGLP